MHQYIKLTFTKTPINSITGISQDDTDFGKVLDVIFDLVPLKGNKNYSLYNNILIDIRNARRKESDIIETTKSDLDALKEILLNSTENNPKLNRAVSFLCETIDDTISDDIISNNIAKKIEPKITN